MDNNYAPVGNGICLDTDKNRYDHVRIELDDGEQAYLCAQKCLPTTFEFMAPEYSVLTENFRGFMLEVMEMDYGDGFRKRQLKDSSHVQQDRTLFGDGAACYCLYDEGTLDNFEIPTGPSEGPPPFPGEGSFRRLQYYDYISSDMIMVETSSEFGLNGTGSITYATPVDEDEEGPFNPDSSFTCYEYVSSIYA